jgi:hypothetical protein
VTTFFDAATRAQAESWRAIRRRRATPPSAARKGARSGTFRAALEQAEQQFRAAENVSYDSRALNLYYGLSQAGRAIVAASPDVGNNEWRLSGHGLTGVRIDGSAADLSDVSVKTDGNGTTSFAGVSKALGSPIPTGPVLLSAVWPLLVEASLREPWGDTRYAPLFVYLSQSREALTPHDRAQVSVQVDSDLTVDETLEAYLARYPALAGYDVRDGTPGVHRDDGGQTLHLIWSVPAGAPDAHLLTDRLTNYRGTEVIYPSVAGMTEALHPLMAWWIVLYALSMITRYHPAEWTRLSDVDRSPQATVIEFVLDAALEAVPDLIEAAIAAL